MKNLVLLALLPFIVFIVGCSNASKEAPEDTGFLEHYESLQPVASPEDAQFYTYENPRINPDRFDAIIIEPIYVYRDPAEESEITRENIENAKSGIKAGLYHVLNDKYEITNTPGPGVMRLKVAITGASIEGEGFKIWNIIPVSAAITLASKATGLDNKKAVLVVELKFTDSQTRKVIKETVTVITGDDFRQEKNIGAEFEALAESWAEQASPVL